MKLETAVTVSIAALLQQQQWGVMRAVAIGTEPMPSTTSTRRLSSLIASSKERFQIYQKTPHHGDNRRRHLQDSDTDVEEVESCELTLLSCVGNAECTSCFQNMEQQGIDYTTLAHTTECDDVINPLVNENICSKKLKTDKKGKAAFCKAIDNCAVKETNEATYDDDDNDDAYADRTTGNDANTTKIDCDALTSCSWDGIKLGYIGDGACHEWVDGCYNHAICKYDGGDCCKDTCVNDDSHFVECGSDGYYCRDPESVSPQGYPDKKSDGDAEGKGYDKPEHLHCEDGETGFYLIKYASFGNGWGLTSMTIDTKDSKKKDKVYEGTMEDGSRNEHLICVPNEPACYDVQLSGGTWGNRVSWQIKSVMAGAPVIASGGAPLQCEFPVNGNECESTCNGQSDAEPPKGDQNSEYHTYEVMEECIKSKCVIQLSSCESSTTCLDCMGEDIAAYCYSNVNFNALVKCSLCQCVPDTEKDEYMGFDEFCATMPSKNGIAGAETSQMHECNAKERRDGVSAIFNYTACSDIDFITAVNTDFAAGRFGRLDAFESCVSTYTIEPYHGGKTALDCMRILKTTIESPKTTNDANEPSEAISNMAYHLYNDGKEFCDCSARASEACPVCESFKNFKTILYESLDACRALDDIDCAAWSEFTPPCQENMQDKFGNTAFTTQVQCDFVHDGCGNAGPFPSLRNLDCEKEVDDKESWDFYQSFASGCLESSSNDPRPNKPNDSTSKLNPPTPQPAPKVNPYPSNPNPVPRSVTPSPTKLYVPQSMADDKSKVEYEPDSSSDSSDSASGGGAFKNFLKFALFCIVCGAGYWYYKRTREFDYVRFRRARNYGADGGGLYSGSTMENSATSFEPPSLPPPPSSYESNHNFA